MILTDAYARAVGIEDQSQVDPREIVKLFARKVSLEEFAVFVNRTLPKPQKYVHPTPFVPKQKQQNVMRHNNMQMELMNMNLMHQNNHMQAFNFQPAPFEVQKACARLPIATRFTLAENQKFLISNYFL